MVVLWRGRGAEGEVRRRIVNEEGFVRTQRANERGRDRVSLVSMTLRRESSKAYSVSRGFHVT